MRQKTCRQEHILNREDDLRHRKPEYTTEGMKTPTGEHRKIAVALGYCLENLSSPIKPYSEKPSRACKKLIKP